MAKERTGTAELGPAGCKAELLVKDATFEADAGAVEETEPEAGFKDVRVVSWPLEAVAPFESWKGKRKVSPAGWSTVH